MRLKCLIVEDSSFMQEIYHYALVQNQFFEQVIFVQTGTDAIKMLKEHKPDIMILDLVLPEKNGLDILAEVSTISPRTKTAVISSLDDEATIAKAKSLGAIQFVKKPFTKAILLRVIEEMTVSFAEVQNG